MILKDFSAAVRKKQQEFYQVKEQFKVRRITKLTTLRIRCNGQERLLNSFLGRVFSCRKHFLSFTLGHWLSTEKTISFNNSLVLQLCILYAWRCLFPYTYAHFTCYLLSDYGYFCFRGAALQPLMGLPHLRCGRVWEEVFLSSIFHCPHREDSLLWPQYKLLVLLVSDIECLQLINMKLRRDWADQVFGSSSTRKVFTS